MSGDIDRTAHEAAMTEMHTLIVLETLCVSCAGWVSWEILLSVLGVGRKRETTIRAGIRT